VLPWVLSSYFAEGLPYSIVHQVSAQYFTAMGTSLTAVGLTSLYGLAWNLKFVWSPLVDRWGTLRRWLLATEILLGIVVGLIALPAGQGGLGLVAGVMVGVSVLAATHDIAVDGFYLSALDKRRQAALSGLRVAAYRGAMLVGNGLLVKLAGRVSWLACFVVAGVMMLLLALFHAVMLPAPASPPAEVAQKKLGFVAAFTSFLAQPGAMLSLPFILLYRAGDALMFAMNAPFQKTLGLGTEARGDLGVYSTLASIGGAIVGGAIVARFDLKRTLAPIAILQSIAILLYVGLALVLPARPLIDAVVVAEQIAAGIGTAAFMVFLMRRSAGEHKASHFAMASALMSVATTIAGTVSGVLAERVGFVGFFALAFALSLPGVVLSFFVPKE